MTQIGEKSTQTTELSINAKYGDENIHFTNWVAILKLTDNLD